MGVPLALQFKKDIPKAEFSSDGKRLTLFMDLLDKISKENDLTPFSRFVEDDFGEGESWFESADGLQTVSGIIKAFQSEKQWSKEPRKLKCFASLMAELKELEHCLEIGKKKKIPFKFFFY